jgi:ferredoxin
VSSLRVCVDRERCCAGGLCSIEAPAVFDHDDDDGVVILLDPAPPEPLWDAVRSAARRCPSQAITLSSAP